MVLKATSTASIALIHEKSVTKANPHSRWEQHSRIGEHASKSAQMVNSKSNTFSSCCYLDFCPPHILDPQGRNENMSPDSCLLTPHPLGARLHLPLCHCSGWASIMSILFSGSPPTALTFPRVLGSPLKCASDPPTALHSPEQEPEYQRWEMACPKSQN